MAKIVLMTKKENIHPNKVISRITNSYMSEYLGKAPIVFSEKYLSEFLGTSISCREGENEDQVILVHAEEDYKGIYETTLTVKRVNKRNRCYLLEKIVKKDEGKLSILYENTVEKYNKTLICLVRSPEKGMPLLDAIEKKEKRISKAR